MTDEGRKKILLCFGAVHAEVGDGRRVGDPEGHLGVAGARLGLSRGRVPAVGEVTLPVEEDTGGKGGGGGLAASRQGRMGGRKLAAGRSLELDIAINWSRWRRVISAPTNLRFASSSYKETISLRNTVSHYRRHSVPLSRKLVRSTAVEPPPLLLHHTGWLF